MYNRIFSFLLLTILSPLLFLIILLILVDDGLPIFFMQDRIGLNNSIFKMFKFRTMRNNTPNVATHLLKGPEKYVLKFGKILRKYSLDELPNLINILKGEMNFIGPRPALYNQVDLIELRTKNGIHKQKPGITGWAQVNGRDKISIQDKVILEIYYKQNYNWLLDIKIVVNTLFKTILGRGVSH